MGKHVQVATVDNSSQIFLGVEKLNEGGSSRVSLV
jgi:hypothetical protein